MAGGGRGGGERERVFGLFLESLATSVVWSPFARLRELADDANNEEEKLFRLGTKARNTNSSSISQLLLSGILLV